MIIFGKLGMLGLVLQGHDRKRGNSETSETSEIFFRGFLFPRFRSSNVPRSKTRKLRKIFDLIFDFFRSPKLGHFPRFPRFRSSNVPRSKTRKLRKLLRFRRPEKVKKFSEISVFSIWVRSWIENAEISENVPF